MSVPISEAIKQIREQGGIPLAVLVYDVERDKLLASIFGDVDPTLANAILIKFGLKFLADENK